MTSTRSIHRKIARSLIAGWLLVPIACDPGEPPTVVTIGVFDITPFRAEIRGSIASGGSSRIEDKGVEESYFEGAVPGGIGAIPWSAGEGPGDFSTVITNLTPGFTYYVSAYARNRAGTSYGDVLSFTAPEPEKVYISYVDPTGYIVIKNSSGGLQDLNEWKFGYVNNPTVYTIRNTTIEHGTSIQFNNVAYMATGTMYLKDAAGTTIDKWPH